MASARIMSNIYVIFFSLKLIGLKSLKRIRASALDATGIVLSVPSVIVLSVITVLQTG